MTRRSSVRAQARRLYCALAGKAPSSRSDGHAISAKAKETKLTRRARALYEGTAVPVREIARLAGVSERTLYKYVARHGWQKRHRVSPRGEAAARANRGRSLEPSPGFAPAKGAGGRFIRRDEQDEPVAVGLKATDPAAAKSAAAHCGGAALLGGIAQAKAEELQRLENMTRAISTTRVAVANWRAYRKEHKRDASAPVDRVEAMLMQVVEVSLTQWEAALAQLQAGQGQRGAIGTS